jgi:hypothetical protein
MENGGSKIPQKVLDRGSLRSTPGPAEEAEMVQTSDLWQTAFLMSAGYWLDKFEVRDQEGRRVFTFCLGGLGVEDVARQYQQGAATCNVRKLRRQMNHLKDLMFGGAHGDD